MSSTQTRAHIDTLRVPGASLHYEVRGSGPTLLLITGGPADADGYAQLATLLADRYTVVTYDTRGNSRSEPDDRSLDVSVPLLANDALHLIDAISGDEPAFVFGNSGGATTGLDLLIRYPHRVRKLVAHEPPLIELLPDAPEHRAQGDAIHARFLNAGVGPAMAMFLAGAGLGDHNDGAPQPAPSPEAQAWMARMQRTLEFFLGHYLRPVTNYLPDLARVPTEQLVVAVGESSGDQLAARTARALADCLHLPAATVPGDHGGPMMQAEAFAPRLHALLCAV
jgi:pimeloyl-ACP methyl ester carboxylesterase